VLASEIHRLTLSSSNIRMPTVVLQFIACCRDLVPSSIHPHFIVLTPPVHSHPELSALYSQP
jgi:hypothetical protein